MIKTGIVGATGYTGVELLRLLCKHDSVEIVVATSDSEKGKAISEVFPSLRSHIDLEFEAHNSDKLNNCDLVFFATPNATAMHHVAALLEKGCKIIDLSADFRIENKEIWEQWYETKHVCPELLDKAVYGLPELNRQQIKKANLIANPGCYPTAILLALLPALEKNLIKPTGIIADAKSGVSGAGRKAALATQFGEVAESFKAYNVSGHRHYPEIKQVLNSLQLDAEVDLTFVPHLVPMNRGILATIYVNKINNNESMQQHYSDYYKQERFVDLLPPAAHPDTRSVRGTNFCRLSLHECQNKSQSTIILSVIDNLVKGAAGQAIQNMNLMFDLDEDMGLSNPALTP